MFKNLKKGAGGYVSCGQTKYFSERPSALASSSGRSRTIDTSVSPPSFLISSGRPSWV